MLELYNTEMGTIFVLVGELGFVPDEMHEINTIYRTNPIRVVGPEGWKVEPPKIIDPHLYGTYWEVMCHYHNRTDISEL